MCGQDDRVRKPSSPPPLGTPKLQFTEQLFMRKTGRLGEKGLLQLKI